MTLKTMPDVKLVIIDPIFRFLAVRDGNEYWPVNDVMELLMEVARNSEGVHILATHHMKKKETEDVIDGALGSTALVGGVDTFLALAVNSKSVRTLATRQRYGTDMEPTQLTWSPESRALSLGASCDEATRATVIDTRERIERDMIRYVGEHNGCTQQAMLDAVTGNVATKKKIMRSLIDGNAFVQSGDGQKSSPFTYILSTVVMEGPVLKPSNVQDVEN
jgi:hypothetical protein